jgi:hypothetical protein
VTTTELDLCMDTEYGYLDRQRLPDEYALYGNDYSFFFLGVPLDVAHLQAAETVCLLVVFGTACVATESHGSRRDEEALGD